jgi:riboflavin biosynthesis pyrimidine reductase
VTFEEFASRKTREAAAAVLDPLHTTFTHPSAALGFARIGNPWSRRCFDGDFLLIDVPTDAPAVSLVFVQSRDGNTIAANPDELGGGPTDKHLIYEGLTRVAADAVLAGATTASGQHVFFSIWRPELVSLRGELGLRRHPAQVVVSKDGRLNVAGTLLFNVPEVPVFVLGGQACLAYCAAEFARRPWIVSIPVDPGGLRSALTILRRQFGITRISAVGGRTTATALVDEGLVQDLCLTTGTRSGGQPSTPWYAGPRVPALDPVLRKRESGRFHGILFEHFALSKNQPQSARHD